MIEPRFNYIFINQQGDYEDVTANLSEIEQEGFTFLFWNAKESVARRQSLGFTDKNGKEIFEGDIVRLHNVSGDNLFEIKSEGWHFQFFRLGTEYTYLPHSLPSEFFEVVGNIYQNADLLKSA